VRCTQERRRKRQELLQLLQEKQEGLDRLLVEEESLRRVRQEQDLMIAKLSDPSGAA
jgi:intraflagellar transport protein 20